MDFKSGFLTTWATLAASVPKDSHTTLWTFLAGLVMFLFVGLPLAATGAAALVGLGSMLVIIGLITIFAAFKMNGDDEKKKRQAQP